MPGQRCLNGYLRRFPVTYLPYHDNIGVLPQNGTQSVGKGHSCFRINRDLVHSLHTVLDGVFHCDDVPFRLIQFLQCCVQRGSLSAAGRPCNQNQSVGSFVHSPIQDHVFPGKPHILQPELIRFRIQHPDDDFFSLYRGQGRNTQVDLLPAVGNLRPSVLGLPFFRYIHACHQLHTGNQCRMPFHRNPLCLLQHAVNPVPDPVPFRSRFQMDITGPCFQPLYDNPVQQSQNRCILCFQPVL